MKTQNVEFVNRRGLELSGYIDLPSSEGARAYAILAHCFTCGKDLKPFVNMNAALADLVEILGDREPTHHATWNAFCLADFGDRGVAFIALPQIPPRNTNWSGSGRWVHWAKIGFEKYYLRKIKQGRVEPFWEKYAMRLMGVQKLRG